MSKRDVEFLYEMGSIRLIPRVWRRFFAPGMANLTEHHFRVSWIAMVIASHEGPCDTGKIAKLALVHDIAESRTGDVDHVSRLYTERNEELGIKDMLGGTGIEKEFLELWEEYELRESIESKIVKDADNLDCDFELREQEAQGSKLHEKLRETRDFVALNKLYTKTAKEMYAELHKVDPQDWQLNTRNRRSSGDWKK